MPKESPTPESVSKTITELNRLVGAKREQVVATFNKIPPEERTRTNLEEIIDKIDRRIVVAIVRAWYPERTKSWTKNNIPEGQAYNFLKRVIQSNPGNFFARINGETEKMSETGETGVLTARDLMPVRESTRLGCLALFNPTNWFRR